jgi:hypothetical protein
VFAGFTSSTVDGALGGREQMHARCAAELPGSHLCHVAEYQLTSSATAVPPAGAWTDSSAAADGAYDGAVVVDRIASPTSGRYTGRSQYENCSNWTSTQSSGLTLENSGAFHQYCGDQRVLACCSTQYRELFRGFTAAMVSGAAGGRTQMHARCGSEFPGAHLCHIAEYQRAASTITPPATGAWADTSGFATPMGGEVETRVASASVGRWTGRSTYDNCENWTDAHASLAGLTIRPGMVYSSACAVARPLACCE